MHDKNPELAAKVAHLLSDVVYTKFLFQGYHWNVLGPEFGEYHEFFQLLYEDLEGAIDDLGENVVKIGFPAPYLLTDFSDMSCISEDRLDGTSTRFLLESALRANEKVIKCHYAVMEEAEACKEHGLMDFIGGRIDMHMKWNWQIKAFLGVR